VALRFVEAGVEGAQGAGEGGNGGVKQGWVHGGLQMGLSSSHVLILVSLSTNSQGWMEKFLAIPSSKFLYVTKSLATFLAHKSKDTYSP
jgi:hypothetical protein